MNSPAFACVSRPLNVMTRENMLVLLESSGKKLAECEGECEVDTGRRLGADLVITGEVLRFGSNYKLNLRLHETRDGQLLAGAQASGATTDELDRNTKQAVVELLAAQNGPARDAIRNGGRRGDGMQDRAARRGMPKALRAQRHLRRRVPRLGKRTRTAASVARSSSTTTAAARRS
jgi:hypothetical protein